MSNAKRGRPSFPPSDVRVLLRVVNELHALPWDPLLRKTRLLESLGRLVNAATCLCTVAHADGDRRGQVVSIVQTGTPSRPAPSAPRNGNGRAAGARAASRSIISTIALPGRQLLATLVFDHAAGSKRAFSPRDREIVAPLHHESAWVYGFDLPLASPEVASLPPRQRQTLQLLIAGHSEKQAASQLRVSTNTVHHYVKAIYRQFAVNSRSELRAKWVKSESDG